MEKAIFEFIGLQERANDLFLRELLEHLILEVPSFDGALFLDRLYVRQSTLPTPDKRDPNAPTSREEQFLGLWRRKIALTEKAISAADQTRGDR